MKSHWLSLTILTLLTLTQSLNNKLRNFLSVASLKLPESKGILEHFTPQSLQHHDYLVDGHLAALPAVSYVCCIHTHLSRNLKLLF